MTKKIFLGGVISGMVMAMMEMMYEGLWGVGFWAPPVTIAATILRDLQSITLPINTFLTMPVMIGIMMHMMNSIILGIIFALLVGIRIVNTGKRVLAGAIFGVVVFAVMWFVALPIIDPVMLKLNSIVFVMTHMIWGGILGFMVKPKTLS